MTVGELREELRKEDQDAEILVFDGSNIGLYTPTISYMQVNEDYEEVDTLSQEEYERLEEGDGINEIVILQIR